MTAIELCERLGRFFTQGEQYATCGMTPIVLVEDFAKKVAQEEREACAKIAEGDTDRDDFPCCLDVRDIVDAIRARGEK